MTYIHFCSTKPGTKAKVLNSRSAIILESKLQLISTGRLLHPTWKSPDPTSLLPVARVLSSSRALLPCATQVAWQVPITWQLNPRIQEQVRATPSELCYLPHSESKEGKKENRETSSEWVTVSSELFLAHTLHLWPQHETTSSSRDTPDYPSVPRDQQGNPTRLFPNSPRVPSRRPVFPWPSSHSQRCRSRQGMRPADHKRSISARPVS
jgi:hypothetical protein